MSLDDYDWKRGAAELAHVETITPPVDDRDQVVRTWREDLGLTCMQVAYGDF